MIIHLSQLVIGAVDLIAAFLFMYGLKRMSSPVTAGSGIYVAGVGMLVAVLASFLYALNVEAPARPFLLVNTGLAVRCPGDRRGTVLVGRQEGSP